MGKAVAGGGRKLPHESTLDSAIAGTVEECVRQLQEHVATGVHRLILIPYEYRPDQVEAIAREIVPRLR